MWPRSFGFLQAQSLHRFTVERQVAVQPLVPTPDLALLRKRPVDVPVPGMRLHVPVLGTCLPVRALGTRLQVGRAARNPGVEEVVPELSLLAVVESILRQPVIAVPRHAVL